MNNDRDLERAIASTYEEAAPSREPLGLLDDVLLTTSHTRQRPSWLALTKEPPMRLSSSLAVGSPMVRVVALTAATLLIALMVAAAGVAGTRLLAADGNIVVDQSGDGTTTTITEAVAMAEDGDTILVKPGTYDESVTVTEDLIIRGDGDRDAIIIELSVEIPRLASGDGPDLPVAFLFDGSNATLENLTVRGESARIVINGGAPVLQDLVLDGIGRVYGLDPGQPTPTGLNFGDGTTATVANSVLTDTDIDIETGSSPSLLDNSFTIGAVWMQGTGVDPVIRGNDFEGSGKWGISIGGGAQPVIEANTIANASKAIVVEDHGWQISDTGTDPTVRGNTISGANLSGILMDFGASATILDNELTGNGIGLSLRSGGVIVTGNTICDNSKNLVLARGEEMPDLTGNEICEDPPEPSE